MGPDLTRSRCVLIGNSTYADQRIPDLPGASASLAAMNDLLTSDLCGWPEERITQLAEISAPDELARKVWAVARDSADVLLCYYVGHGMRTSDGQLALALGGTDPDPDLLPDTAAQYERLAHLLRGSQAASKLVILDCCHAELGNKANFVFQSADMAETYPVDGLYFVGASAKNKKAKAPLDGSMTYFTEAFVRVVRAGVPGLPQQLHLDQIFRAVRKDLIRAGLPEPVESGIRDARHFPFALNAAPPASRTDQAEELVQARRQNDEAVAALHRPKAPGTHHDSHVTMSLAAVAQRLSAELGKLTSEDADDAAFWIQIEKILLDAGMWPAQADGLSRLLRQRVSADKPADPDRVLAIAGAELLTMLGPEEERGLRLTRESPGAPPCVIVAGESESQRALVIEGLCKILADAYKPVVAVVGVTARSVLGHPLLRRGPQPGWRVVQVSRYQPGGGLVFREADLAAITAAGVIVADFPGEALSGGEFSALRRRAAAVKELGRPQETLLVYDATVGMSELRGARLLREAIGFTGIVVTRVDIAGKPLAIASIQRELSAPVKYLQLTDRLSELVPFSPRDYASALIPPSDH